jgi:hypothetical protein
MAKQVRRNISTFFDYSIKQHDPPSRTERVKDSYFFSAQLEEPIAQRLAARFAKPISLDTQAPE